VERDGVDKNDPVPQAEKRKMLVPRGAAPLSVFRSAHSREAIHRSC
jgi:hypothetical protein